MAATETKTAVDASPPSPKPVSVDYPNGSPALRFTPDGAGFAYYPAEEGRQSRVAVCVSKVNSYQNKFFFYDNSSQAHRYAGKVFQIPKRLLCSIDEHVVGHGLAKFNKDRAGVVASFLLSADGGTLVDGKNNIMRRWLWDSSRQNAGTPPRDAVEFRLNKYMKFKFVDRANITVVFKCDPVKMEFDCGEKLRRLDNYLEASSSVKFGELRGKRNIELDTPSLLQRQKEFFEAMRHKTILLYPDSNRIRHPELKEVMAGLEKHFAPYERKIAENEYTTTPYPTAGWKEEALAQTLAEVPQFTRSMTDLGGTLPVSFQADPLTLGETLKRTGGRGGGSGAGGAGAGATMTSTMRSTGSKVFGEAGGLSGIAKKGDKWLGELDVRKRISERHPILTRSVQLKNASGRYCIDVPVDGKPPPFKKLSVISRAQFDDFLANVVPPQQLVLVACLREDDPACRTATQIMEHVNGTLYQRYPPDETTGENRAPYRIVKFDMASSRYLTKRFGIHSLPMYLMFLNNKLVHAGTLGGAKVRMPDLDLKANYMLLEPDARSQMRMEKVLRKLRVDWDLACTINNALNQSKRLAENAVTSGPKRRYGALATSHAVVLASCDLSNSDVKPLQQALARRSRGGPAPTAFGGARLVGDSLVAISHPIGTVLPSKTMCAMCMAAVEEHKGKKTDPQTLADVADERSGGAGQSWTCPRCAIVQNPSADLLTGGFGSVAVCKPIKPATIRMLSKLWNTLQTKRALERVRRTKGPGKRRPGGKGDSKIDPEDESDADGAHLGLTHDDVLRQLKSHAEAGKRGQFLPADFKFGLALSSQDTVYKGVPLRRARSSKRV